MDPIIIPQPDSIPVAWGWFQFLLLLTFPLHLLAMNAMVGGLFIAVCQQFAGGNIQKQLAHRIAVALPMVIAFVVNFGVAPLLFVQVLYGQFVYTSSILMGTYWILIVPILIVAYYGAYLYDFKFNQLGKNAPWIGLLVLLMLLAVGFFFTGNMLLMALPELFRHYFAYQHGSLFVADAVSFWPRFFHMMLGAVAIGGLFVALLARLTKKPQPLLARHGEEVGLQTFLIVTIINSVVGFWYLLALPSAQAAIFMGGNLPATVGFLVSLFLTAGALYAALKRKFVAVLWHGVVLVVVMSLLRSWLRSSYLQDFFTLDQLELAPQYSPMVFFFVTLVLGVVAIGWMLRKTVASFRN